MQDSCITVQEKVVVPAIVQKPKFIPDPSWGNLDECPDNDIWFVVTDDKPTTFEDYIFVQYSSFNVKSYKIDWGDGSEIYTAIAPAATNITNHKYLIGNAHLYFQFAPLSYDAIIEIFNQLPNFKGESVRVININGCAGTSELTEEDIKIATDKNWQVIGV